MKPAELPPEWRVLEGMVSYVQRVTATEYSCTCPFCGGDVHENGEWPDRCRLFVDENPTLYCRRCGVVKHPEDFGQRISEEERRERERVARESREREQRRAQDLIARLRTKRAWESWDRARESSIDAVRLWEQRGIPLEFQRFWQLGYVDSWGDFGPALSIPVWQPHWEINNVKLRLLRNISKGKYRYYLPGVPAPVFFTNPSSDINPILVAVEGEIKACVVWVALSSLYEQYTVIGLGGKNHCQAAKPYSAQAERSIVIFDPDVSPKEALQYARSGGFTHVMRTPAKIDDAIIANGWKTNDILRILKQAYHIQNRSLNRSHHERFSEGRSGNG